jgi:hypothetical protein
MEAAAFTTDAEVQTNQQRSEVGFGHEGEPNGILSLRTSSSIPSTNELVTTTATMPFTADFKNIMLDAAQQGEKPTSKKRNAHKKKKRQAAFRGRKPDSSTNVHGNEGPGNRHGQNE